MQIVYISNRIANLQTTLKHVEWFMPFVDQVVICSPRACSAELESLATPLGLSIVFEDQILSADDQRILSSLDHQQRNYLLRSRLIACEVIDDQFIMSDDDSRPLRALEEAFYIDSSSRYQAYYFYGLAYWDNQRTDFDRGQHETFARLCIAGLPVMSYASHMPQIINKRYYLQANEFFTSDSPYPCICEWTSYFNFATHHFPESFRESKIYETLCWPEHPLAWYEYERPAGISFENFTSTLYRGNSVFSKLQHLCATKQEQLAENVKKIALWRSYMIRSRHPEQSSSLLRYLNPRVWYNKLNR